MDNPSACAYVLYPAKLSEKHMVPMCISWQGRSTEMDECAGVTLAMGWTPKPSCNFSTAQMKCKWYTLRRRRKEMFLQTGRKEDSTEMLHSPSDMITSTSTQEETDLRFECTVNHCKSQRPVWVALTGNGLWPPTTATAKVFCL